MTRLRLLSDSGPAGRALLMAVSIVVVGCGSSGTSPAPSYSIGGAVVGLAGHGLVLATPGQASLAIETAQTTFAFNRPVPDKTAYAVTVVTQPAGPDQTCQVVGPTGQVEGADVRGISVVCSVSPDAYASITHGPKAVVALARGGGFTCSGSAFLGAQVAGAPVYVLTAGHCVEITYRDEVRVDRPNDMGLVAHFGRFADAQPGDLFSVAVTSIRYATMWGHDLAVLELDTTRQALAARGVSLPTLAAQPPAGGGVFTYGFRDDDQLVRRTDCAQGPRVWVQEGVWTWMSALRGECPITYIRPGSSGSPVYAGSADEIFGVVNTRSEILLDPICQLNYPCEIRANGAVNLALRAYFQDATRLRPCFTPDGVFQADLAGCRLPRSTFSLANGPGAGELAVLENAPGTPVGPYRFKVAPLATFDPHDASAYGPATTGSSFLFTRPPGRYVVTAISDESHRADGIDPLALHVFLVWQ